MSKVKARVALLALLLPLLLNATSILRNDILNNAASKYVEQIGDELFAKTGVHGYVIATNEQQAICDADLRTQCDHYSQIPKKGKSRYYSILQNSCFYV